MKKKYFLHRENAPFTTDTVVYRLWVGESVREQRMLTRLVAWAFETGATLRSWSEDIDFYLQYESERCFSGRGLLDFGFIQTEITAREALDLVVTKSWDIYEKSLSLPKNLIPSITLNSPSRIFKAAGRENLNSLSAERRKYLKPTASPFNKIIRF